jgi:hypothetical protein
MQHIGKTEEQLDARGLVPLEYLHLQGIRWMSRQDHELQ